MHRLKNLFTKEKCPVCGNHLIILPKTNDRKYTVKCCPEGHYKKEIHPHLETTIQYHQKDPHERWCQP